MRLSRIRRVEEVSIYASVASGDSHILHFLCDMRTKSALSASNQHVLITMVRCFTLNHPSEFDMWQVAVACQSGSCKRRTTV
jgi:hypothetical protein